MALFKELKILKKRLKELESYKPSYPLGKWIVNTKIENVRKKIKEILKEIKRRNERD